ncbi:hypothetical protein RhiirA1_500098 [Rhizophagus irregularis]|uniref:Uncharacterized protein n=1 Tax=Rhizophagus irregularis TaxID=588596 RepID=A0A2I1ED99_9GLOM|nr:hypothetical protein RhiirA1_500098 [Rhizophagus irregularis]PKY20098.1 hypothetical protein RhiirB3_496753 [Rhizophagus irregularis]
MDNKEMPCNWLLVGETRFCKNSTREKYCASHAFKIRKGVIIPQPCKGCGRGTKSSLRLCIPCGQDIGTISVGEFELDPLADFYHPALIPPLSTLAERADIRENFIISVESAVVGGNYSNLSVLIGITWERKEMKTWRDDLLVKFLHHSNLAPAKYRPEALYDAFSRTNVLGPEHILALARTFY